MRKNLSCPQFLLLLLLLFRWKLLIDPTISKATSDPKCLPWKTSSLSIFEATFRCFSVDRLARLLFDGIETVLSFVAKIFMMTWLMNLWFFLCWQQSMRDPSHFPSSWQFNEGRQQNSTLVMNCSISTNFIFIACCVQMKSDIWELLKLRQTSAETI